MSDEKVIAIASSATRAQDFEVARGLLEAEGTALAALAESLDDNFIAALDLLSKVSGRVVVTGMGKSGHVARKIAATMASTGTPAQFVHPGEASHGDLGMITPGDAVLALSNSGKTPELCDIIAYSRKRSIPLIGMTSKAGSELDLASDATLILPNVEEACPMGLAPTTSTTMMIALGDALAVALLERNNFTAQDYKKFHPGGALGQRLLRVCDLMHEGDELPLCDRGTIMGDALLEMTKKTFGCVGIVGGDGDLIGIITDGDLRRHMGSELPSRRVEEVMTSGPRSIHPEALAAEALGIMNANSITSLFVRDNSRPIGIVRIHDCIRANV